MELPIQLVPRAGLNPTFSAASVGGDYFANTARQFVIIKNDSLASVTVTVISQKTIDGLDVADLTVTVPASEQRFIGLFSRSTFNDPNGDVHIQYSATASVLVAAIEFTIPTN